MGKFTTVLWDIGGVLLTNGWDHNGRKQVMEQLQIPDRDAYEERHAAQNDAWEKGEIGFDEYLRRTLFYRPRPFSLEACKQAIEGCSAMLEDSAYPVLQELHALGTLRMGQLNNESRELNDMRLEKFGLKRYLSFFFCSGYVRLRKPDPAFYELALEVLQVPAEAVIFVDDREKNVAAAQSLGIHGIQYKGSAALRAELVALGLLH